ncbi:MAG: hypothetical protein JWM19_25 [Actinomycetia bacterium]|nr:hypothetical protein [Actinomycetes bacterium]
MVVSEKGWDSPTVSVSLAITSLSSQTESSADRMDSLVAACHRTAARYPRQAW